MAIQELVTEPTEEAIAQLFDEIERYLAVVDAFRAEGAEPTWANDEALPEWWLGEFFPDRDSGPVEATV